MDNDKRWEKYKKYKGLVIGCNEGWRGKGNRRDMIIFYFLVLEIREMVVLYIEIIYKEEFEKSW